MPEKFFHSLDQLRTSLGSMGITAGEQVDAAFAAFLARDHAAAREVIAREDSIDAAEIRHEGHIVGLIARHQPVARDLRLLVACLRVNSDIERAGDLAVKIARNTIKVPPGSEVPFPDRLAELAGLARAAWADAIDAFIRLDEALAQQIRDRDAGLDRVNSDILRAIAAMVPSDESTGVVLTNAIAVSKHLERLGDTGVDVALETIYAASGELARHARAGA